MKNRNRYIIYLLLLTAGFSSCRKFLDVGNPVNQIVAATAFSSDQFAISAMAGVYLQMSKEGFAQGWNSISLKCGLAADEFNVPYPEEFYQNTTLGDIFWPQLYNTIYNTNNIIEQLEVSASPLLSSGARSRLTAESKFIRAFCYFYLVNLHGDVPLILSTAYAKNAELPRTKADSVYNQIVKDLEEARENLTDNYTSWDGQSTSVERTRPTKLVATALLARVHLYRKNYEQAEIESKKVIAATDLYHWVGNINETFLKNSSEAIWQLQPRDPSDFRANTFDASAFLRFDFDKNDTLGNFWLNPSLTEAFESSDLRRSQWIRQGSDTSADMHPYKYKVFMEGVSQSEYLMVMRLSEQYLILAESLAAQGKTTDALDALNAVRTRAGASELDIASADEIIEAVLQERRLELFTEWGHRWLDLKRLNRIDDVMSAAAPYKRTTWEPFRALFAIPYADLQANENLVQNQGYPSPR